MLVFIVKVAVSPPAVKFQLKVLDNSPALSFTYKDKLNVPLPRAGMIMSLYPWLTETVASSISLHTI